MHMAVASMLALSAGMLMVSASTPYQLVPAHFYPWLLLRCERSKSCLFHYFGLWLIQQPVVPYRCDNSRRTKWQESQKEGIHYTCSHTTWWSQWSPLCWTTSQSYWTDTTIFCTLRSSASYLHSALYDHSLSLLLVLSGCQHQSAFSFICCACSFSIMAHKGWKSLPPAL